MPDDDRITGPSYVLGEQVPDGGIYNAVPTRPAPQGPRPPTGHAWLVATVAVPMPWWRLGDETDDEAIGRTARYVECGSWCGGNLADMLYDLQADEAPGPCGCEQIVDATVTAERPATTLCAGGHPQADRSLAPHPRPGH